MKYSIDTLKYDKEEILRLLHGVHENYMKIDSLNGEDLLEYFLLSPHSTSALALFAKSCQDFMMNYRSKDIESFGPDLEKEIFSLFGNGPFIDQQTNNLHREIKAYCEKQEGNLKSSVPNEMATNNKWIKFVQRDAKKVCLSMIGASYLNFFDESFRGELFKHLSSNKKTPIKEGVSEQEYLLHDVQLIMEKMNSVINELNLQLVNKQKKTSRKREYTFEGLFTNPTYPDIFLKVLQEMERPVINLNNQHIGEGFGIFPLLYKIGLEENIMNKIPKSRFNQVLNQRIGNLTLTIDGSEHKHTYKKIEENKIRIEFKALFAKFSKSS